MKFKQNHNEDVYSEFMAVINQLLNHPFLNYIAHVYTSKYENKWLKCFILANEAQAISACMFAWIVKFRNRFGRKGKVKSYGSVNSPPAVKLENFNFSWHWKAPEYQKAFRWPRHLVSQFSCSVMSDCDPRDAHQASLSITNSKSIKSVIPSSHLILCCPLLPPIPSSMSLPVSQLFAWGGWSIGVSA